MKLIKLDNLITRICPSCREPVTNEESKCKNCNVGLIYELDSLSAKKVVDELIQDMHFNPDQIETLLKNWLGNKPSLQKYLIYKTQLPLIKDFYLQHLTQTLAECNQRKKYEDTCFQNDIGEFQDYLESKIVEVTDLLENTKLQAEKYTNPLETAFSDFLSQRKNFAELIGEYRKTENTRNGTLLSFEVKDAQKITSAAFSQIYLLIEALRDRRALYSQLTNETRDNIGIISRNADDILQGIRKKIPKWRKFWKWVTRRFSNFLFGGGDI